MISHGVVSLIKTMSIEGLQREKLFKMNSICRQVGIKVDSCFVLFLGVYCRREIVAKKSHAILSSWEYFSGIPAIKNNVMMTS